VARTVNTNVPLPLGPATIVAFDLRTVAGK
jgi:hypothetical protein